MIEGILGPADGMLSRLPQDEPTRSGDGPPGLNWGHKWQSCYAQGVTAEQNTAAGEVVTVAGFWWRPATKSSVTENGV